MNKVNTFTSTGMKLMHHPLVISGLQATGKATPISLQIAPTSKCNLNCDFCSNSKREKNEELTINQVAILLEKMANKGSRTVEWTGGGDPTMWSSLGQAMNIAHYFKYEQGLITNGLKVAEMLSWHNLARLKWMRISMNCLDYVDEVNIPSILGTLGFSYVWNSKTTEDVLARLDGHIMQYNPKYVRIVPDCQATVEEQLENNIILAKKVTEMKRLGPYFFQPKEFDSPERCWWGHFKPFILHDGYVYPCSSVVLNTTSDYTFHKKFRWCRIEDLPRMYDKQIYPFKTKHCDHCVFKQQNDLVESLVTPTGMENFI